MWRRLLCIVRMVWPAFLQPQLCSIAGATNNALPPLALHVLRNCRMGAVQACIQCAQHVKEWKRHHNILQRQCEQTRKGCSCILARWQAQDWQRAL